MGIDRPKIRTVNHNNLSPSVEAYLQESSRTGRDREAFEVIEELLGTDQIRKILKGPWNGKLATVPGVNLA